jgi:small subunit ribosomal protein S2
MSEAMTAEAAAQQRKDAENTLDASYFAEFDFGKFQSGLEEMLKAGVHFGHLKSRRHPKMDPYIYTTRKNINIIDLEKAAEKIDMAGKFLADVAKSGKPILFVGMKKQTHATVRSIAERLGEHFVIDRWLGGTLTNFSMIRGRARHLVDSQEKSERGEFKKYTKFEQSKKTEEIERLVKKVGGIRHMQELPGVIVIADVKEAGLVIDEARKMRIPLVGIVDTNADPSRIDYPIPANDDALSSLRFVFSVLGKAVVAAKVASKTKETAA